MAASDVVGEISAQNIEIRAEHLAATAVMAGCRFEYGSLLRALSQLWWRRSSTSAASR